MPTRSHTQDVARKQKRERTNSVHYSHGKGQPMGLFNRSCVNQTSRAWQTRMDMQDVLKVAVFSQEDSRSHSTNFHRRVKGASFFAPHKGARRSHMNASVLDSLKSKVIYHKKVKKYEEALTKLFENKECPHVIAVIEGARTTLCPTVTLGTGHSYTLHQFHLLGKTSNGRKDGRQNMHFYIRDDMRDAVTLDEAVINISTNKFKVGEIQFETENGEKYSLLVTHTPNKFSTNLQTCDKALRQYKRTGRTVVGYIGDTNYTCQMMQPFSSPSSGGNVGDTSFLSPASSGARQHTYFMQAVTFGKDPASDRFIMTQPSTLNIVELQIGSDKTATDHPSIQTNIIVGSAIKNRTYPAPPSP